MAWRPTEYLLEGELDNTNPSKVTGWMQFAGTKDKVTFNLEGNFHRDIRGAKIRFTGNGYKDDPKAAKYMDGFSLHQSGETGDITAGLPLADYVSYPYLEWYGQENGRVVIELAPDQIEVIGRPIPACESDPIPRVKQQQNMAKFIVGLCRDTGVVAIAPGSGLISEPQYSHWVVEQGQIVGEAHSVESENNGMSFAYVRLFNMPEMAEFGSVPSHNLQSKNGSVQS